MVAKSKGFTLIETLVALAISAMLLGAITSYGLAFMQVSREGEVAHRLQRELVFSFEAIEAEMRIAKEVVDGGAGVWTIMQIAYSETSQEYTYPSITLAHDADAMTLTLGNRVLSRSVAVFTITPGTIEERLRLHLETMDNLPMIKPGNLPLVLEDEVVLRNFGFVPPGEEPEDPEDPPVEPEELLLTLAAPAGSTLTGPEDPSKNIYVTVGCTTSVGATCQLEWRKVGGSFTTVAFGPVLTTHSWSIGPFRNNDNIEIRITADDPVSDQLVDTGIVGYKIKKI